LLQNDVIIFFSIETTHNQESFKLNYRKLVSDPQFDQALEALNLKPQPQNMKEL